MPDNFDRFDGSAEELRVKRESLRKVEAAPDLLREYDQRVGVPVSNLWAIDNESSQRREQMDRVRESPIEIEQKKKEANFDLEKRLEDLESALIPQRRRSVEERRSRPKSESFDRKPRNVVVDYAHPDKQEAVVHSSFFPTRNYPTVEKQAEPEIRPNVSDFRVESAPPQREFPTRSASLPREPRYRSEVTVPSRREPKFETDRPERPRSGYSAFAPKPFMANSERPFSRDSPTNVPPPGPIRPGDQVTYNFRLSGSSRFNPPEREPEPRPTTYRTEYRQKMTDLDNNDQDDQNIVTR